MSSRRTPYSSGVVGVGGGGRVCVSGVGGGITGVIVVRMC